MMFSSFLFAKTNLTLSWPSGDAFSFFSSVHLTLEGRTQMYICMFVLPSLSLPFSCDLPFVRSPTLVRTIKIDHFTAAGVTIYIYICMYIYPLPFFLFFSFYDRLNLWMANEAKRADRTGSSSLNRTDTHPSFLFSTYSTSVR